MALPFIGSLAFFDWCRSLNCQQQQFEDGEGGVISVIGMQLPRRRVTQPSEQQSSGTASELVTTTKHLPSDGFYEVLPELNGEDDDELSSLAAEAIPTTTAEAEAAVLIRRSVFSSDSSAAPLKTATTARLRSSTLRKQRSIKPQPKFSLYDTSSTAPSQRSQFTGVVFLQLL